ncbi:MAG: SbcC/MukB-like Walker B domain-containing protein [Nocardioidaceae bacterium]
MEEEAATALLAQTAEPAQRRVDAAKRIVQAADSAFDLLPRLEKLTAELVAAQRRRLELRENWLDLRERRLAGIAAELAHQLSDGGNCPVCGSTAHPSPAKAGTDPVDRVTEGMALELSQQAEERIAALEAERGALTTNKAAADALTGGLSIPQAVALLGEATADAEAATDAATRLDDLQTSCLQMQERAGALVAHITGLDKQVSRLQATLDSLSRQTQRGQAQLTHHRGEWPSMSAKFEALQHELTSSSLLLEALKSRQSLEQSLLEQHRGLTEELRASGFSDLSELEAANLSAPQRANVEALNRSYCDELAATMQTLADPVLREAGVSATPDLDALVETVEVAASEHLEVAHVAGQLSRCQQRLSQLADDFALALDELTPLLQARDVATELASMCAGTAVGNSSKTKLSHYVLGARLQQVVSAANLRLAGVCGGRYQLLHSMVRSVGDARGGLGLMVLDTYTGQERDPATLSGGETFYVSLALALGLADLVRDEVGGAELSTLFVDEGFGSLDPETLDDVMDEIDSLRSGGRCVGLVSHLADLKLRVPTQVELLRSPAGYTSRRAERHIVQAS